MSVETITAVSWWMILPLGILGSLLHFLFDWSNHNRVVALLSAVNESYWEHIKIAIWPVLLLQAVMFALGGYQFPAFIPAATVSLYSLPISMVGLIYHYKAIAKRNILWVDISVFFVIIALAQTVFVLLLQQLAATTPTVIVSALFLAGLIVAFLRFTIHPPQEPDMFIDPLNQQYGLNAHPDLDSTQRG